MFNARFRLGAAAAALSAALLIAGGPVQAATKAEAARMAALETQVQGLLDREALRQVIIDYARSIDARDWATHRSLFMDKVEVEANDDHTKTNVRTLDDLMAGKQRFFGRLQATQHMVNTLKIEINGDEAHLITMLHAQHYLPNKYGEPIQRMIGTYDYWLTRTPQGWKIHKYFHNTAWNEGNSFVYSPGQGVAPAARPAAPAN